MTAAAAPGGPILQVRKSSLYSPKAGNRNLRHRSYREPICGPRVAQTRVARLILFRRVAATGEFLVDWVSRGSHREYSWRKQAPGAGASKRVERETRAREGNYSPQH